MFQAKIGEGLASLAVKYLKETIDLTCVICSTNTPKVF